MGTILETDENGTLHLPPALLPRPGPHRRYLVAVENGHLRVEAEAPGTCAPWMELAGCMAGEAQEMRRIDALVAEEFGTVNPDDWR